jgi:signal transduction histidine kinase
MVTSSYGWAQSKGRRRATPACLQRCEAIRTEQIRLLYANAPAGFLATALNAVLLALTQWSVIPAPVILVWLAYMLVLTGSRAALVWQFQRCAPAPQAIGPWGRRFGLGTLLAGIGWGGAGVVLFPVTSITHQVFLAFVLGGMIAGAVGLLSARMPVFLSFVCPAALPIIVRLLTGGDGLARTMGGMAALFTLVIIVTASRLQAIILSSLHLRFDNADLVTAVTAEKERVEHLNTELTAEVTERRRAEDALRTAHEELEVRVQERTVTLASTLVQLQGEMRQRQQLAEQLRQAQKMEAIGRLAGGIAHDFNNLLTAINGYSLLALRTLPPHHPLRETLEHIAEAGARASTLTSRLLAFSRRQVLQLQQVNLNTVVADIGHMLTRIIGEDVRLEVRLFPTLWPIKADPAQLEHVIVNLAVNARDAMPHGGTLSITTANVAGDFPEGLAQGGVEGCPYVMLTISDTGVGMSDDVKAHLFEPFFTTKEVGKGTGLGLPLVYGVVKQSEGHIQVQSAPGHGTTFRLYFPPMQDELPEPETERREEPPNKAETILLVEDETIVRSLVRDVLLAQGYTVLEAENGEVALHKSQAYPDPIHLLVTDVVMPGIPGRAVAEQLVTQRPQMQVLFMSGYTDDAVLQYGVLHASMNFIQKPFTPEVLVQKIRDILG